jgi:RNA polymerase sigma-70 factor (ECF subfamily)
MDDADLLRGIAAGDPDAFAATYRLHADAAYGYASALVGPGAAAEDLVHDAFLGLVRATPRLAAAGALRGYLLRAIRNRAADRARSFEARTTRGDADLLAASEAPAPPPDASLDAAERAGLVRRALAALPEAQCEALVLKAVGGLRYEEIGALVGAPAATVRNRLRAGAAKLREMLSRRLGDV